MLARAKQLPERPGVYYMKNGAGVVVYVGKASNLRRRVRSYFERPQDARLERLVAEIRAIEYQETPSVLEALILEANEIRRLMPKYNVRERDDKSYLYLVFTRDRFPKPELVRGHELARTGHGRYRAVYGPYLSASSIRAALKILRKIFPYSTCEPPRAGKIGKPCFYYHLKLCPGVCVGAINAKEYSANMRHLGMVFAGKKTSVLRELRRAMRRAATEHRFEDAARLRNKIFALEHIQDVAVLTREERPFFGPAKTSSVPDIINIFGRIEGYDISMVSGVEAVGSMVVFEDGEPKKSAYRKFRIKWVKGINDVAMMKEVLRRRFARGLAGWPRPDLILIDGGWGQVNAAKEVQREYHQNIPLVGIAKGFDRKQDRPIHDRDNLELARLVAQYRDILLRVRDEAHRFAVAYHRLRMRRRILKNKKRAR